MTAKEILAQFQATVGIWKAALDTYSDTQLRTQPAPDEWSIGQVYIHILRSALFFHSKQVEACLQTSDNSNEPTHPQAVLMFEQGSMPPDRISVPASPQYTPPQPESKAQILTLFGEVEAMMKRLSEEIDAVVSAGKPLGKTPHPRFQFFSAMEWFQLIEMHYRHHLHQKGRIDEFLAAHAVK